MSEEEYRLTEQSRSIYLSEMLEKETRSEIIGERENDEEWNVETPAENVVEEKIKRKLCQIKDKSRKKAQAEIEAASLFHKKSATRMDAIDKRHPDIGEVMEKIVADADVGADKWRRTGVYTFSGDLKKEEDHIQESRRKT